MQVKGRRRYTVGLGGHKFVSFAEAREAATGRRTGRTCRGAGRALGATSASGLLDVRPSAYSWTAADACGIMRTRTEILRRRGWQAFRCPIHATA